MNTNSTETLKIPFIGENLLSDNQDYKAEIKRMGVTVSVDKINWEEYSYQPNVQLFLGYSGTHLWLLFEVKNDFFRAKSLVDQEAVWEDSCVEFFMSVKMDNFESNPLPEEVLYRNFEFNAVGTCLSAYGSSSDREMLTADEMKHILRFPGLINKKLPEEGDIFDWEMGIAIPLNLLGIGSGSSFRANFYKCGDLTQKPHFLSWRRVESESPDFHLPQFFGEVELVR